MIKGIIFDLFNTLIYEERSKPRSVEFAQIIGKSMDDYDFMKGFEKCFMTSLYSDFKEPTIAFLKKIGVPFNDELIQKLVHVLKDFGPESFRMYEDVRPALFLLKKQYKLALLTNVTAPVYQAVRGKFKLEDTFEGVTTSFQLGHIKPQKEAFLAALNSIGLNRDQVIFIGDSFKDDIRAAENVGLNAVLMDRKKEFLQCDKRIELVNEIIQFLK